MSKHGSYPRVDGDHYPTPDWTIAALAEHGDLAGKMVWEPCAGSGQMAEALKAAGVTVFCSDIVDRGPRARSSPIPENRDGRLPVSNAGDDIAAESAAYV